jgi:hypothetical protein
MSSSQMMAELQRTLADEFGDIRALEIAQAVAPVLDESPIHRALPIASAARAAAPAVAFLARTDPNASPSAIAKEFRNAMVKRTGETEPKPKRRSWWRRERR